MSEPPEELVEAWRQVKEGHLWIQDGKRIVCTHCGVALGRRRPVGQDPGDLKKGLGDDECPDTD